MSSVDVLQTGLLEQSQWQLSSIQLVNFGPFDGYHLFSLKTGFEHIPTTVIAGDSGTGKSTLEDAFFEVMTRNGSYNTASNEGGRGGSLASDKRSLIGYVRGKLEDVEDENGNPVAQMLRDGSCNRWSAVVLTYEAEDQTVFTVAKLFWIGAGYNTNSDIKQLRLTMYQTFDPRVLEPIANVNFTAERVRRVLGNSFRAFSRVDEFLTYVYRVLHVDELGQGKDVMDLLGRIRSGAGFRSIAELFREQVLDVPGTFARAEEAARSYHEHMDAYERMRDKQQQVEALTDMCGEADEHARESARLEAHNGALSNAVFGAWEQATHLELLEARRGQLEAQVEVLKDEYDRRNDELELATATRDELLRQLAASGYTQKLAAYDNAVQLAIERTNACRLARSACEREVTSHFGKMPSTAADFGRLQQKVQSFRDGFQAADEQARGAREKAMEQRLALDAQAKELREDLSYYEQNKSRIPRRLGEARAKLSATSGIPVDELPFVAELMEVVDEKWRYAIESVYGGFARTLLVDADDFERFSSSIDALKLRSRVTFRKVETGLPVEEYNRDGYLSQKLEFSEESPFAGWVKRTACDEHHDAKRVFSARQLDGPGRRVTINGQTRDGSRGAHGRDAGAEGIIGFDNTAKVEALAKELVALTNTWQRVHDEEEHAREVRDALVSKRDAAERIASYQFEQVDLLGAHAHLERAQQEREQFLANNEQMEALEKRLQEAEAQVTTLTKQVGSLEDRLKQTAQELRRVMDEADEVAVRHEQLAAVDMSSDAYLLVHACGLERLAGRDVADNLRGFEVSVERVRSALEGETAELNERVLKLAKSLERKIARFQERWPDGRLGTTLDSLPDYRALLAKLEREGFHKQTDPWFEHMLAWIREDLIPLDVAYRDARTDIDDRLDPINAILRTLPFGREGGRLEIVCRSHDPKSARDFAALLRELLDYERNQQTMSKEDYHRKAARLIDIIDPKDPTGEKMRRRNEVLDRRRHVTLSARVVDANDPTHVLSTIRTLASKSGGEVAEIVAFILGAALLYRLGRDGNSKPGFAPVLLDEGFIKADSRFTSRAISAWQGFGFQLIIAVPEEKYQSVVSKAERVLNIVADESRRSYVSTLDLVGES